ncbi:SURF1 family protein [uncultured Nocardioides sp.]|uniref:SURF1-like protein n=1 Tax=uncultured Nocardioides sp. TaxID=198441 RepID=A0A6J4N865_9ACTN|nr:SURF1 family protein [uncultured Nocardioides sp.]CAA9376757.1 MAG: Cytochrome oxidase biogenesis protein Surf1, facilitates heme A insertion [uncultured Nocardioides sp.]
MTAPRLPRLLRPAALGVHLLAAVLVAIAGWLGFWQLEAWQAQRAAEASDLTRTEAVALVDAMGPDDPFPGDRVGQPVTVQGTWVPGGSVYVEGREHDGEPGFWAVTPLAVGGPDAAALLVVRGWAPTVADAGEPPTGQAAVTGWLQPPDGTGQRDEDPGDDVLPQLRIADAIQHVDQDLYGAYAVVDPEAAQSNAGSDTLVPADLAELPKASRFTALRNFLYAIEWWFFGAFAAFIWWRWVRDDSALGSASVEDEVDSVV